MKPASPSAMRSGPDEIEIKDSGAVTRYPATATLTAHHRLLDIDVLTTWLTTTPRHVRRLVAEKRVPYVKVGHFVRFDPEDISQWLRDQRVAPEASTTADQPPCARARRE
jgi:excisionase family DNA binding protein